MSQDPDTTEIAGTSLTILSTAAAAFGPAGAPLFILAATLGALIRFAPDGRPPPERLPLEDRIRKALAEHIDRSEVKNALAKILPACETYLGWAKRIGSSSDVGAADLDRLKADTWAIIGPNSNLREGMLMLYNRSVQPNDYSRVQYAVPQYLLGASVYLRFRMIDVGLTHIGQGGVQLVPQENVASVARADLEALREEAAAFDTDLEGINRYVGGFVIDKILYDEMQKPGSPLAIGAPNSEEKRRALDAELRFIYLGGAATPLRHRQALQTIVRNADAALAAIRAASPAAG